MTLSGSPEHAFYGEDLAYVHHVGYGEPAQRAGRALLQRLPRSGLRSGLIVDLGCGSGIWARAATKAGYDVLGIDRSAAFVDLARQHAPGAEFRVGSAFEVAVPSCVAVTAFGEVLNYQDGRGGGQTQLGRLIERVFSGLVEGGWFLFDVLVSGDGSPMRYRNWHTGPDYAVLIDVDERMEDRLLERRIVLFREVDGAYRRSEEHHVQCVYDSRSIMSLLTAAGFEVEPAEGYDETPMAARRVAFWAQKRVEKGSG